MDFQSEEEEEEKKLVYIFMTRYYDYDLRLICVDPHDCSSRFTDMTSVISVNRPPDFVNLVHYSIAALESKIYFIGGSYYCRSPKPGHPAFDEGNFSFSPYDTVSNKVFAFDTASQTWDTAVPSMKLKRGSSTVVTHANKIYVFGFLMARIERGMRELLPDPQHWSEFYDPQTREWNFLPGGQTPFMLMLMLFSVSGVMVFVPTPSRVNPGHLYLQQPPFVTIPFIGAIALLSFVLFCLGIILGLYMVMTPAMIPYHLTGSLYLMPGFKHHLPMIILITAVLHRLSLSTQETGGFVLFISIHIRSLSGATEFRLNTILPSTESFFANKAPKLMLPLIIWNMVF